MNLTHSPSRDLSRRTALAAACTLVAAAWSLSPSATFAQDYPSRPIKLLVPQAAASATDVFARLFTTKWGELLGQSIVVDNRPGAGAIIGTEAVAKAAPDGYTLLLGGGQSHAINKSLYRKLSYDPIADFTPVGRIGAQAMLLVISSTIPAKSLSEFLAYAKSGETKIDFASSGNGSTAHLAGTLFSAEAGLKAEHVPYKAVSQALTDLLSGRITMMFYPYSALKPHIQSGRLIVLAVATEKRVAYLPQVPTLAEKGFPSMVLPAWFGIYAPAGTPSKIIDILYTALETTLIDPDVVSRLVPTGTDVWLAGPGEFAKFNASEIERYRKIVELAGAKVE